MSHRSRLLCLALLLGLVVPVLAKEDERGPKRAYPPTRTTDAVEVLHGERIPDPYRWLEPDDDKEVEAWDHAQMDFATKALAAYPERARLKKLIAAEFGGGSMRSLPSFHGGRRWFTYRPPGGNHAILYVTSEDGKTEPKTILDPNGWSADGNAGLESWHVSPDGSRIAYRRDEKGSEDTTIFVRDLVTGKDLPDVITRTKFSFVEWSADGKGFYYARLPDPKSVPEAEAQYHRRIYYHKLGAPLMDDVLIYGAGRPMLESKWLYRSSDGEHVFVNRGLPYRDTDTLEVVRTGERTWRLDPIIVDDGSRTFVDRHGDTYILNTDKYKGERQVFTMQRGADGTLGPWTHTHFVKQRGVIEDVHVVGSYVLCHQKEDVVSRIYIQPVSGTDVREIKLPGPGTVGQIQFTPGKTEIWFRFESYSRPPTTYRCDLLDRGLTLHAEEQLDTTVDVDQLTTTRLSYPSKDGTKIPLFVLHRKDTPLDASAITVLYGYGGFRVGLYPRFSRTRALWASMGHVFCVANLRGGNEFGEAWHQAGCLANKQNVYDDFIAGADWLVKTGKAARDKLAVEGGSNGGLLTAVVVNQRPDLCRAGISSVPLTDMLRYHRFQYAKSWTMEYGDPDVKEEFDWIRPYSPYHNVKAGAAYPAMLVKAGLADGRVNAFHARKMAAIWQAKTAGPHPIYCRVDRNSGHGSSNISTYQAELLDTWSFLLMQLRGDE